MAHIASYLNSAGKLVIRCRKGKGGREKHNCPVGWRFLGCKVAKEPLGTFLDNLFSHLPETEQQLTSLFSLGLMSPTIEEIQTGTIDDINHQIVLRELRMAFRENSLFIEAFREFRSGALTLHTLTLLGKL